MAAIQRCSDPEMVCIDEVGGLPHHTVSLQGEECLSFLYRRESTVPRKDFLL